MKGISYSHGIRHYCMPSHCLYCINAGWKMTGVLNYYRKLDAAGDLYVGRWVLGWYWFKLSFFELIPYFDFSGFEKDVKELMEAQLDSSTMARMPGEAKNDGLFGFFKCLALFSNHQEWLESTSTYKAYPYVPWSGPNQCPSWSIWQPTSLGTRPRVC